MRHLHALAALTTLMALLVTSCGTTTEAEEYPPLFFPFPPAQPRIQYLTSASGAAQTAKQRSALERFAMGDAAAPSGRVTKPYGIAARNGVVYVCDTKRPSVARLDFKDNSYSVFGAEGSGRLMKPVNLVIDPVGYKFVVDPGRKQIVVFGPDDKFVASFDLPEECHPVDVAVKGNELFVLDNDESCQILVLNRSSGEVLRTFGELGQGPGQFHVPNSLDVDDEGNIYVSDTLNYRIQKLAPDGTPIWQRGGAGYQLGLFGRPRGIRVGPDGVIYVVEGAMQLVQMFDTDGEVLMRFGGPGNIPGTMLLPAAVAIDKTSIPYFSEYLHEEFEPEYLLFVTNQYGEHLVNVYAFGAFPEGYRLDESTIATLDPIDDPNEGIGAVSPDEIPPTLPELGHGDPVEEDSETLETDPPAETDDSSSDTDSAEQSDSPPEGA